MSEDDDYLYIATNNHVVADSEELTVQFDDDSVVKAEIRGTDPDDDLAVVRVKESRPWKRYLLKYQDCNNRRF